MMETKTVRQITATELAKFMIASDKPFQGGCIREAVGYAHERMTGSVAPPPTTVVDEVCELLNGPRVRAWSTQPPSVPGYSFGGRLETA